MMYLGGPSVLPQLMWSRVASEIAKLAMQWVNTAMPLDINSHAEGSLIQRLSECNIVLRDAAAYYQVDATGWSIRALNPESFPVTHAITLVAVDPNGVGHDIERLAWTHVCAKGGCDQWLIERMRR